MVAGLSLIAERVEDEAVRAELFLGNAVVTLKVFVTLPGVFKGAVRLGAVELACERK